MPRSSTLTFHARGDVAAVQAVREALLTHQDSPLVWGLDTPEALKATVTLAPGFVPDFVDLEPVDVPGLELALVRSIAQDDPLPPVQVARVWQAGQWFRSMPGRPFEPA